MVSWGVEKMAEILPEAEVINLMGKLGIKERGALLFPLDAFHFVF